MATTELLAVLFGSVLIRRTRQMERRKADGNVGVLQAAVNSTDPKHNNFVDPPMIETTTVHLPELRFKRHSLLSAWNAPS